MGRGLSLTLFFFFFFFYGYSFLVTIPAQVLKLLRHEMEAVRKKAVGAMHRLVVCV